MSDDKTLYIRRSRSAKVPSQEPYQPEYERLKVDPIKKDSVNLNLEFRNNNAKSKKVNIPPQVKVSSGNVDRSWDNVNEISTVDGKNADIEDNISYHDVPVPLNSNFSPSNNEQIESEVSISTISPNSYILLYGDVIMGCGEKSKILEILENIVEYESEEYNFNDFVVLKKLDLKVGIFIDNE